ncbi:type IV pilus modification protein PilV [Sessilibacter corallicola]|uniref:type IV pilus modification protein PilV n=1 Tax=Sessilibacter corallicola TaxID=2904075 RepID=UPI001E4DB2EB|nr:type IV pilus modification protein PilV [Sessilibacter corallicola]MCE2028367.1 type IV pilus modification protein PilV [Sessilibacter corallicola]
MKKKSQSGITLIEILVTLIILSIGFLGLASVQLLGTRNVSNSSFRSLATIYAYDMVERMRANQVGVESGDYQGVSTLNAVDPGCSPCGTAERAQLDLFEWGSLLEENALNGGLPNGSGAIDFDGGNREYTITITWSENVREDNGPETVNQNYSLVVRL